jgi:hypothetical protein
MSTAERPTTAPPVSDEFETWLRATFVAEALDIELPAAAGPKLLARGADGPLPAAAAGTRSRRRWVATALVAAAVMLLIAGATVLPRVLRGDEGAAVPAHARGAAAPTFFGVQVGWLPKGLELYRDAATTNPWNLPPAGDVYLTMDTVSWAPHAAIPAGPHGPEGEGLSTLPAGTYTLMVLRPVSDGGIVPNVEGRSPATTVQGHPAAGATIPPGHGPAGYSLSWTVDVPSGTPGGVTDHADLWLTGPDEAVVRRIAENLLVGPRSIPADQAGAVAAMTAAAAAAFDGASGVAMADAVDDPAAVLDGIRAAVRERPGALRAVSFAGTGMLPPGGQLPAGDQLPAGTDLSSPQVTFLSDTDAELWVWITGTTKQKLLLADAPGPPAAPPGTVRAPIRFTLTPRGWKVRRAHFCGALAGVVACPTSP